MDKQTLDFSIADKMLTLKIEWPLIQENAVSLKTTPPKMISSEQNTIIHLSNVNIADIFTVEDKTPE